MKPQFLILGLCALLTACNDGKRELSTDERANLYLQMGIRYMEIGELKIAKEKLETAVKLDSSNPDIQNALAVFYEKIERPADARSHYESAVSLDPENAQSRNNYGRFLCTHEQYAEGLAQLNVAIDMPLNDRKWFALTNAGICKKAEGDKDEAEAYFRKALEFDKNYPPALLEMQKLSYEKGEYMSARAFLERYVNVAPQSAESLWYGYQTERSLGNQAAAEKYRQALLKEFPNSTQAQSVKKAMNR